MSPLVLRPTLHPRPPHTLRTKSRFPCTRATTTVTEHITLVSPASTTSAEELEALVDQLWSLQYMAPNVLTAAAGPLVASHMIAQPSTLPTHPLPPFSHVVHTRFGNDTKMAAFLQHPKVMHAKEHMLEQHVSGTLMNGDD